MKEKYLFRISFLQSLKMCISLAKALTLFLTLPLSLFILIKQGFVPKKLLDILLFNLLPIGLSFMLSLFLYLIGFIFPVALNSNEIRATNYFGIKKTYKWEMFSNIEWHSVSGLPYLVFETDISKQLWIPTFLGNRKEFNRLVLEYTRSKNPKIHKLFSSSLNEN